MTRLARHAMEHPRFWLLATAVATLVLGAGLPRLELLTDGEMLHPSGHPLIDAAERDRQRFGDPRQAVLLVEAPENAPALASPAGFRFLDELHSAAGRESAVRPGGIVSIAGLLRVDEGPAGLSLGTHLAEVPDDPAAFAALREQLRASPRTDGLLLSSDGRLAALYLPLSEDQRVAASVTALEAWRSDYPAAPFVLSLTGPEVAEATLGELVLHDLAVLVPMMMIAITLLLGATLRSAGGVAIPLAEAGLVLIWVFGFMGWVGVPITLVTTILPVVLMAMAITDELHLLERIQAHAPGQPLGTAVATAIDEVGRPIVATSVTTALGFLSFLGATVVPMQQFGVCAALGILLAMFASFTFIPALIVSLPHDWFVARSPRAAPGAGWLRRAVKARPGLALLVGTLAVAASIPGLFRLEVQDAWVDNFAKDAPLVAAERRFNDAFWGSYRFDVVLEAEPDFFYGPAGAGLTEELVRIARDAPHVGGALSYLEPLQEVQRALGEEAPLSSLSPLRLADIATVAEMGASRFRLRQLLSDDGAVTRVRLFARHADYKRATELRESLERKLPGLLAGSNVAHHYSGELVIAVAVVESIVDNQLRSIGWALATVAIALLLLFARGLGAALAMVPVLAALAIVFGGMGYAGLPLGIATSMFAALTVGIGVDFGIHFLYRYRYLRQSDLDADAATASALDTTGTVLGWNAVVLALGFLVLTLSGMGPNQNLGVLLAAAILACHASALLLLPRLLPLAAGVLVALALLAPPPAEAAACPRSGAPTGEVEPEAWIAALETDFRRSARIVRMDIDTTRGRPPSGRQYGNVPNRKTLWGVFDGNVAITHLVYVFSGPGRLAGTTLLLHDHANPDEPDSTWLYLRSFDLFKKLAPKTQGVLVPGTALTYEDSRGFIPIDKYRFSLAEPAQPGAEAKPEPGSVLVLGCPRSDAIREHLGYRSLLLRIDHQAGLMRQIEYRDLGGRRLKTYTLVRDVEVGDRRLPGEVQLEHHADAFTTTITYEYWLPSEPPPPSLFEASNEESSFLERLQTYVTRAGLGERIRAELDEADVRIREFEERLRRIQDGR